MADLTTLLPTIRACQDVLRRLGGVPLSAEQVLTSNPLLRAAEAMMPGIVETFLKAADGDKAALHRLEALGRAGDPPPIVH